MAAPDLLDRQIAKQADGAQLVEMLAYDHRLIGAVVALQEKSWKELLDSIPTESMRRKTAHVVAEVRAALGKDFEYARRIAQGEAVA